MTSISVIQKSHHIKVDPISKSVSVVSTGPPGPPGPATGSADHESRLSTLEGLVSGSSGVRDILGLLKNDWTATRVRLHRVGNVCEIQVSNLDGSAATGSQFLDLGSYPGWSPIGGHLFGAWDNDNNVSVRAFISPTPTFTCVLGAGRVDYHHVWTTTDPFPTDFPGV